MVAQRSGDGRARRPKVFKLVTNLALAVVVAEGLRKRWSPAEVAARLALDHPDDPEMRVSHETIYTSLYLQGKGGLKRELIAALRSGRLRRRPCRCGEKAKRANVLGPITPISARPPEAADRAFPGHWEGDLIMGAFNRSALVTVVESQRIRGGDGAVGPVVVGGAEKSTGAGWDTSAIAREHTVLSAWALGATTVRRSLEVGS